MKITKLRYRCYVIYRDGLYIACCVDLCLAAQSYSRTHAKEKLYSQVEDYLSESQERRLAPFSQRLKYCWLSLVDPDAVYRLTKYTVDLNSSK